MPTFAKKKYFQLAKGFYGRSKNCIRICAPRVEKSLQYAYRDRKVRPRLLRQGWIHSINAALTDHYINYSRFIYGLNRSNLLVNRKILADLAMNEPYSFKAIVDEVKIQSKLEDKKKKEEMSYLQAFACGNIIQGKVLTKQYEDFPLKYQGKISEAEEKLKHLKN